MRIGIDAHIVGAGKGGVERFLYELCMRLPQVAPQHEFVLLMSAAALRADAIPARPGVQRIAMPFSNPLVERALVLPWLACRHRLDVLLVQRLAPWAMGRCRVALAVHDLTPLKFPGQYRGLTNRLVRLLTAGSVRRSDLVLTPSATVAREVAGRFGAPLAKFGAYYNGVDHALFNDRTDAAAWAAARQRLGIGTKFLFTSGAMERRKNFTTVLEALRRVPAAECPQLLISGGTRDAAYGAEVERLAASEGLRGRVRHLGFVSDADLVLLYRHALAFVSASLDEGFDMPVLEAMACGTPVLCSDIPVHRELFDGSAMFFRADAADELAAGVRRLAFDPVLRAWQVGAGLERAAQFGWERAARRVAAALDGWPDEGDPLLPGAAGVPVPSSSGCDVESVLW